MGTETDGAHRYIRFQSDNMPNHNRQGSIPETGDKRSNTT